MQTDAQRRKYIQMTESPVEPLICKMAVPTIISMLITSIYNMADTFFVGRLGTSATGAVGVVFPLMALIQAVGFFFGQGSGNYISRQLGAQHREEAERMAATGFLVDAADFVRMVEKRQGIKISAPEEIAFKYGWIDRETLLASAERYGKSPYGQHLKNVADGKLRY